jgi:hypothetical protein
VFEARLFLKGPCVDNIIPQFSFRFLYHLYAVTKARVLYLKVACCLRLFTTLPPRIGHTTSFETKVYVESEFNAVGRCSYFQEENIISVF